MKRFRWGLQFLVVAASRSLSLIRTVTSVGCHKQLKDKKSKKSGGSLRSPKHKNCQSWGKQYKNLKNVGKNSCKWTKMNVIWEKIGNPLPFERVMGPNRHNMENYGDLQPIAGSMKPRIMGPE